MFKQKTGMSQKLRFKENNLVVSKEKAEITEEGRRIRCRPYLSSITIDIRSDVFKALRENKLSNVSNKCQFW